MAAKFTPERFVEVWMKSDSVKDVARTLRVSQPYAHQIATQLRKEGVRLKGMPRGRQAKKIDVASLNQIVDKHDEATKKKEPGLETFGELVFDNPPEPGDHDFAPPVLGFPGAYNRPK